MKKIYLALVPLMLVACNKKTQSAEETVQNDSLKEIATEVAKDTASAVVATEQIPELTDERIQELVSAIPEHGNLKNPTTTLSEEYYKTWTKAYEMPDGGLGEIGNNEFLYYFVCGNDPCPEHSAKIQSKEVTGNTAIVKFYIVHTYKKNKKLSTFNLKVENGNWVIADFDNTLKEMKDYIVSQREYLQSDDLKKYAESILNNPETSEEWKDITKTEMEKIKKYLEQNPK